MTSDVGPVVVGVFAARSQAERAADELRVEGYREDQVGVVSPDALSGPDATALLLEMGAGPSAASHYGSEVAAGMCLLVVDGARGTCLVRVAVGRNCGSFCLPEEVRDGK